MYNASLTVPSKDTRESRESTLTTTQWAVSSDIDARDVRWNVQGALPGEVEEEEVGENHLVHLLDRRRRIREARNAPVGAKVAVHWPYDDEFYNGKISAFDATTHTHQINYDDGDVELLKLEEEMWYFGGRSADILEFGSTGNISFSLTAQILTASFKTNVQPIRDSHHIWKRNRCQVRKSKHSSNFKSRKHLS